VRFALQVEEAADALNEQDKLITELTVFHVHLLFSIT